MSREYQTIRLDIDVYQALQQQAQQQGKTTTGYLRTLLMVALAETEKEVNHG